MLLAAPNKSMKTFLGLNMASAIAAGKKFVDIQAEQHRTLYVDMEIGDAEAKKRMKPLADHYGKMDMMIRTSDEKPFALDRATTGHENLMKVLDEVRPGVVFFDALKFMTSSPENDNTEMGKVMGEVRRLKLMYKFTAVIIHHMGKESNEGPRSSRGASVIEDSPDSIGYINATIGHGDIPSRMSVSWKLRNHSPVDPSRWTLDQQLGIFVPTPPRKEKVNGKRTQDPFGAERQVQGFDISAGLLQPMSEDN